MIKGYDNWKTSPPDEPDPVRYCNCCGDPLWDGDTYYDIDGGICKSCLNDRYKKFVEVEEE